MSTLSQEVPPGATTPKTIASIVIIYSDGTALDVDMESVHALSWYKDAVAAKAKGRGGDPHIPGAHRTDVSALQSVQSTDTTTLTASSSLSTAAAGTSTDKGTCYWDGDQWVC